MAKTTNFLIGKGELLTSAIKAPGGGNKKAEVYTFPESKDRLIPQIETTANTVDSLPKAACPNDFVVTKVVLNPSYIAKSYFPASFLKEAGLTAVGSRNTRVKPKKWSKKSAPTEVSTTEIFVAGTRADLKDLPNTIGNFKLDSAATVDFTHLEKFSPFRASEKIRSTSKNKIGVFEVGIHLLPDGNYGFIIDAFEKFGKSLGIKVRRKFSFQAGNMLFLPVEGESKAISELAKFSFLRVLRVMPKLRGLRPFNTTRTNSIQIPCDLPIEQPISSTPKVAILDGGLPKEHCLGSFLNRYIKLDPKSHDDADGPEHGLGVTSAFLFGAIAPGEIAKRPYSYVDHLRVLDKKSSSEDPYELYRTLGHVEQVLLSRQYEFLNLSLGPYLPVEDTDIHAWTSVIDDLLSDGETFLAVAAGNNGGNDWESGNARIQVPSDCVNAVTVGASDRSGKKWKRASYSAIGPGRSPGFVKPDLLAFGGDVKEYFHHLSPGKTPTLVPTRGTSFASPDLLRSAVGIRSILGQDVSPLAIKALLIHSASQLDHDQREVGWGKSPENLMEIITCDDGVARLVYQGELKPGKFLRAPLPMPSGGLSGRVKVKATFCYATPVDPQDSSSYTRSGLIVTFRPDLTKFKDGSSVPKTKGFFEKKVYATEQEQRSDMGKWETVLHSEKGFLGKSLNHAVFDIHYNAREAGAATSTASKIKYALVLTIEAKNHPTLYNDILKTYANILMPIQPQISLPIRIN